MRPALDATEAGGALGSRRIRALTRRFGTPLYAYDFDAVESKAKALRAALAPRFDIFYAVKANPSLAILKLFASLGLGADVASRGELALALRAGVPSRRILMTGPAKTDADLDLAVESGILGINVEGEHEIDRLDRIARKRRRRVAVHLRLNPEFRINEARDIIGGQGASKFGLDLRTAERILRSRGKWPSLDICGFQVFQASNVLDAEQLLENVRHVLELAVDLARRYEVTLRTIDLGGGLGVPYSPQERPLDLPLLSRGLRAIGLQSATIPELAAATLLFEPGRWLVAEAGVYVTQVIEVKTTRGRRHVLVDGGIHHLTRPALLGTPHPVRIAAKTVRPGPTRTFSIGGPLCTNLDTLADRIRGPLPFPGDLVIFGNAGAYGYTESMPLFLSHEWPAEIGVRGDHVEKLRAAPTVAELQDRQVAPDALIGARPRQRTSSRTMPHRPRRGSASKAPDP
jgi:diaminopimelate decarboxylase